MTTDPERDAARVVAEAFRAIGETATAAKLNATWKMLLNQNVARLVDAIRHQESAAQGRDAARYRALRREYQGGRQVDGATPRQEAELRVFLPAALEEYDRWNLDDLADALIADPRPVK